MTMDDECDSSDKDKSLFRGHVDVSVDAGMWDETTMIPRGSYEL